MKHAHPPLKCEQRLGVPIHCHLASLTWNNKTSHLFSKGQRTKRVFLLKNSWIRIFQICLNNGIYGIYFWRSQKQKKHNGDSFSTGHCLPCGACLCYCMCMGREKEHTESLNAIPTNHTYRGGKRTLGNHIAMVGERQHQPK